MPGRPSSAREGGLVLLVVLVILLVVTGSSTSFIWFMNQQQTRAGARYRSEAALAAAEAGVHYALARLESLAVGKSSDRTWKQGPYREVLASGSLGPVITVSIDENAGGEVVVTSRGEAGGIERTLRGRVVLASTALLAAIYGAGYVRFDSPPAATIVVPYGAGLGDRPWVHVAARRGIWFATSDVSLNRPGGPLKVEPGPLSELVGTSVFGPIDPGPVRLLLGRSGELLYGPDARRVDLQQLTAVGVYVEGVVLRDESLSPPPRIDASHYQHRATENLGNAAVNEAAGRYLGDSSLASKRDSYYSAAQFEQILQYLASGAQEPRLRGVIYVAGGVALESERLEIVDGALVAEGSVTITERTSLEITHSAATRTLPGLIVLEEGGLVVAEGGRLRVHGLVYASKVLSVEAGAYLDIVGSVQGNDPGLSFVNSAGTVIVRYDPAVLGTLGLRVPTGSPVIAWLTSLEELR